MTTSALPRMASNWYVSASRRRRATGPGRARPPEATTANTLLKSQSISAPNGRNASDNPFKQVDPDLPATQPVGTPPIDIKCGPLLRYWGLSDGRPDSWRGSILIVTNDSTSDYSSVPYLNLSIEELTGGLNGVGPGGAQPTIVNYNAANLFHEHGVTFWRFDLDLNLTDYEQKVSYSINQNSHPEPTWFYVPSRQQNMNIMFYSCNGFSLGVAPEKFDGQLWDDVLNQHEQKNHFHVMLGGGDQLYCDKVKVATDCILHWSHEKNPIKKRSMAFTDSDKDEVDQFYLWHYISWFGLGYFKGPHGKTTQSGWPKALARIPMINIFDDHDIIDGFGSYTDGIMKSPYFVGIGRSAFKYYLLFQQCVAPDESLANERSWIVGPQPGPYIGEKSRSIYARLGPSVAFVGLDCRTERSHHTVVSESTYRTVFDRLYSELRNANAGQIRHLIVMLGVPIAYPRMVWLERILTSDLLAPIKLLTRKGFFSGLSNEFDDGIEILDDLDDHWCARHHKKERNEFVSKLQDLARDTNVRITILGGDVHLAGIGRFYSRDKSIEPEKDYRHMLNIISSAIVNTPPPDKLADFLNKRSKIHHFGQDTDEDMVKIFSVDIDGTRRNNERLLPRRNWCSILPTLGTGEARKAGQVIEGRGSAPVSSPEEKVYRDIPGSLSVVLHMEQNQHNKNNLTIPYEVTIPPLER